MFHNFKALSLSLLVVVAMLSTAACDPKVTSASIAQSNYVASGIIQLAETTAETLVYGESRLAPEDANVLMNYINSAAGISLSIAAAQLKDGATGQVAAGLDSLVKFKPKFSNDPKTASKIATAKIAIESIQAGLRIANLPDKGLFPASEEDRKKVQDTIDTSTGVVERIAEWRKFYGVDRATPIPPEAQRQR